MTKIKLIRKQNKLTQAEFAKILNVHQTAVSQWETDKTKPDSSIYADIAKKFNVSLNYLMNIDNNVEQASLKGGGTFRIPVYGSIPAGIPMEAIEDILDYEEAPEDWRIGGKEFFALKIKGNSMEPEYRNGDIIIFLAQPDCENNEDCAVSINGNDWTFKRVEKTTDGIFVKPLNPSYETKFFNWEQCQNLPVEVKGVFWELRRSRR